LTNFVGASIRNLLISFRRASAGGGRALRLYNGHDVKVENVKVDLAAGTFGQGIALGNSTGATAIFNCSVSNCKVMSDGGASFVSNNTNTSIKFDTCYSIGGYYNLVGSVYSTLINCACDGAPLYAYNIQSNCQGVAVIGCGAETAGRGAIYLNQATNVAIVAPLGSGNNTLAGTGYGSLVQLDSGGNSNITIINPVDASPNAATTASIYGTTGTGTVQVINANSNYMSKGIGGDTTWRLNYLTVEGDSNVEVQSFTATIGSGWTNVGTPTVTGTFVKKGKYVTFNLEVSPSTSIEPASGARINMPWTPSFNGSCTQLDGNGNSYGVAIVSTTGQIFCQSTGVLTVPLYFQGGFYIA